MTSTRIASAVAISALLVVTTTSCSGAGSGGDVELTFWDGNAIPERTAIWNEIIADFEAANPGTTVEYVGLPQDSSGQKFDTAIATNSAPDIGVLPRGDVSSYQAQDGLVPLDEYLAASPLNGMVAEAYLDQTRRSVPDGALYAMPTHALQDTIWYRPAMFEDADIEPPRTWAEFADAAEQLSRPEEGQFGFTLRGGEGAGFHLMSDMYTSSGITEFFDASGQSTIDDPRNLEALERIVSLYGTATPSADATNNYTNMLAQFTGGKIAMMQHNIGSYPTLRKTFDEDEVAPLPLPLPEGSEDRIVLSGQLPSIGIFDEEHAEESWKFIEFAMQADNNSRLAEQAAGIPTNTEAQQDGWVQDSPAIQMALDVLDDPSTTFVQTPAHLPEFNGIIRTEIEPMFQEVLLGDEAPAALLEHWATRLEEAQAAYEERNG